MARLMPWILVLAALAALAAVAGFLWQRSGHRLRPGNSIEEILERFEDPVRARLQPELDRIALAWPPQHMVLVGLKQERLLEVWLGSGPALRLLKRYPILAASGTLGPKLREGDRQVPEGLYEIESLNPNSRFHLALRVNYPNPFDLEQAAYEGRTRPGSDIMIHGSNASIGCLAMGDPAAEELFVLAARTGLEHIAVILSPVDFRVRELPEDRPAAPAWTGPLYTEIRDALERLR